MDIRETIVFFRESNIRKLINKVISIFNSDEEILTISNDKFERINKKYECRAGSLDIIESQSFAHFWLNNELRFEDNHVYDENDELFCVISIRCDVKFYNKVIYKDWYYEVHIARDTYENSINLKIYTKELYLNT